MTEKSMIIHDSLKIIGVAFVFTGVIGIIVSSLVGIFQVIIWWQSILLVLLSIFVTTVGFFAFNGGPYSRVKAVEKHISKKRGKSMSFLL
ncbi:MAG: hypothetical protein Q7S27_06215 [Nanoarchaeota archaeon]|nr:hypothetical protein [Nanoarchaeota archaeon]